MSSSSQSTSELSEADLHRFTEAKRDLLRNYPQMKEEDTKTAIITDFVNLLGWEIPQDGEMEYNFGDHRTHVVDYAFSHNGTSKLFVEAKAAAKALKDKHRNQLGEYLLLDNVDLGILTNGDVYELYQRVVTEDGDVEAQQIARISLPEFSENAALLSTFTKTQVTNGTYSERLERIREIQTALSELEENQNQLAERIVESITAETGDIAERPVRSHVVEFLESVSDGLLERSPGHVAGGSKKSTDDGKDESGNCDIYSVIEAETMVSLSDEGVVFTGDATARDHYCQVIRALFEHDHIALDELPVGSGHSRYLLNTVPEHKNGNQMHSGSEIVDGVYAELNASTDQLKRHIEVLVERDFEEGRSDTSIKEWVTVDDHVHPELVDNVLVQQDDHREEIFPTKTRESLSGEDSTEVAVYACNLKNIGSLKSSRAWGLIRMSSEPEYFCIYITAPHMQIQLVGEVSGVLSKDEFLDTHDIGIETPASEIDDSKVGVEFSEIHQMEEPIELGEQRNKMQGLLYTTLGELKAAETTDDL